MILFSYKGKHLAPTDRKYLKSALPLLLGMLVCMVCLAGTTWAWFTASTSSGVQVIQSADYSVTVQVSYKDENEENRVVSPDQPSAGKAGDMTSYSLAANITYTVTLTPKGTASKGYCILVVDGEYYYTDTLPTDGLTFTYRTGSPDEDITTTSESGESKTSENPAGSLRITWYWGTYPDTQNTDTPAETATLLSNGDTVGTALQDSPATETDPAEDATEPAADETAETDAPVESTEPTATTYTVESGDTLSGIAAKLGTTAAKLAAYNGIENPDSIQAGQVLQIPPADYEIPVASIETTTPSTTTPTESTMATEPTTTPETTVPETTTAPTDTTNTTETSAPTETTAETTGASDPADATEETQHTETSTETTP